MKKVLIIGTLFLVMSFSANAQATLDIVEKYALDTAAVFSEIRMWLANDKVLAGRNDLTICPIYQFIDDQDHSKDAYLDYSFMDAFEPRYTHPEKFSKWRASWSWLTGKHGWVVDEKRNLLDFYEYKVYDSLGFVVGLGPYRGYSSFIYLKQPEDTITERQWMAPTDLLFNRRLDYLIAVVRKRLEKGSHTSVGYYYGINLAENQIYVVIHAYPEAKMYKLEDVVNERWDDFKDGLPCLLKEIREESAKKAEEDRPLSK